MSAHPVVANARRAESHAATLMAYSGQTGSFILKSSLFALIISATVAGLPASSNAQPRQIASSVYATFERSGSDTELIGLAIGDLSPGSKVTINCSGVSCPWETKTLNVDGTVKTLAITDMFVDPIFKPGTVLEIRVTRPGTIGRVFQYHTVSSANPRVTKLCLKPGSANPEPC